MISPGPSVMRLADFVNGNPYKPEDLTGTGHPVIRIRHLLDSDAEPDLAEPPARPVWIGDGDLIFSWSATLAVRIWDRGRALLNQHLYRVDTRPGIHRGWFKYVLETGVEHLRPLMHGSTMTHITQDMLRSMTVAVPPPAEQRAIADYLDAETARIDALIAKKQQLIHLLDERLQSMLFGAIGDWRTQPSRTLRQFGTRVLTGPFGTVLSAEEYIVSGVPLVNPTHIIDGRIVPEDGISVSQQVAERISRHRLAAGDLVMGRKGDVGRAAIVTADEAGWICGSDSIAIRCGEDLLPEFLAWALRVHLYRQQLARTSTGAMVANVNEGTLLGLRLPALRPDEQRSAVQRSTKVSLQRDQLRERLLKHAGLLAEHRQALITGAVAGRAWPEIRHRT